MGTVTKFVDGLVQIGFVREGGYDDFRGGRRPTLSKLVPQAGFAVGVGVDSGIFTKLSLAVIVKERVLAVA